MNILIEHDSLCLDRSTRSHTVYSITWRDRKLLTTTCMSSALKVYTSIRELEYTSNLPEPKEH